MDFLHIISDTVFINNLLLVIFFAFFILLFASESRDKKSPVNWIDLLIDLKTKKVSVSKMGQLLGIFVSNWVVITMAGIKEAYSIYPLIFSAYLAFIGGTYAFNTWLKGTKPPSDKGP